MSTLAPRAVFITRESEYELLIARHSTEKQASFFLTQRGQKLETLRTRQARFAAALHTARAAVPADWRQAAVSRSDLDRFLFSPEDVIIAVGQDGLIANVAKYLEGQPVIGVNPAPDEIDGILVRHAPDHLGPLLRAVEASRSVVEERTMVEATFDSGERLTALNEIFIGHRSHQSARYIVEVEAAREQQSSSGMIVASGTGATGWASSIMAAGGFHLDLAPTERAVAYFVREAFASKTTGVTVNHGCIARPELRVTSRMNDGGTVFADGIEQDRIAFDWGRTITVGPASRVLRLVQGA